MDVTSTGRFVPLLILSGWLLGAEGCPLFQEKAKDNDPSAATGDRIDVGGTEGALWQVELAGPLTLTLRAGEAMATAQTDARLTPVELLGNMVDAASFCWRPDIACPQHVLAAETLLAQDETGAIALTFNRRGPLVALQQNGLLGRLDGRELSIPLPIDQAAGAFCALRAPSAILATAFAVPAETADDESDETTVATDADEHEAQPANRATQLEGRITVAYDGMCLVAGGSAALAPESTLELSARFSARRR